MGRRAWRRICLPERLHRRRAPTGRPLSYRGARRCGWRCGVRRAANIDSNQTDIVKQLRKCGVTVQCLHALGQGVPDLLCGWRGVNILLEIKDEDKPASKPRLTQFVSEWHGKWDGPVST